MILRAQRTVTETKKLIGIKLPKTTSKLINIGKPVSQSPFYL